MPDAHLIVTAVFLGLGGFAYLAFLAGARGALVEKAKAEAEAEAEAAEQARIEAEQARYEEEIGIPEVGSM